MWGCWKDSLTYAIKLTPRGLSWTKSNVLAGNAKCDLNFTIC